MITTRINVVVIKYLDFIRLVLIRLNTIGIWSWNFMTLLENTIQFINSGWLPALEQYGIGVTTDGLVVKWEGGRVNVTKMES